MSTSILVSGSRDWIGKEKIRAELLKYPSAFVIVGDCKGADALTAEVVKELGSNYRSLVFVANWKTEGRSAGPKRNVRMLDYLEKNCAFPKEVLIFHSDLECSKGSKHVFNIATARGYRVKIIQ